MAIRRKQTQEETEQTLAAQIGDLGNDLNMEADGGVQQEVYDDVCESDVSMCHITQEDWNQFYKDNFTEKDIDNLKKEVK